MKNKKALSQLVTTVIIIVVSLIAIGVVWEIISNLIGGKEGDLNIAEKCLSVDVVAVEVTAPTEALCFVTLKRRLPGEAIDGVNVIFESGTGSLSEIVDVPGDVPELTTVTKQAPIVNSLDFDCRTAVKAKITPYIFDDRGKKKNCPQTTEYSW